MSRTNLTITALGNEFHPVSHYDSPAAVLGDPQISVAEKRLILSGWASDMYAVEARPELREIPGIPRALHLADILAALRQLDREDQPPRPRGGAAIRLAPSTSVSAVGGVGDAVNPGTDSGVRPFRVAAARERFSRTANIRRYRKLLATRLADQERRFVERRLAEELNGCSAPAERRGSSAAS
jgi:hypothetical protein